MTVFTFVCLLWLLSGMVLPSLYRLLWFLFQSPQSVGVLGLWRVLRLAWLTSRPTRHDLHAAPFGPFALPLLHHAAKEAR